MEFSSVLPIHTIPTKADRVGSQSVYHAVLCCWLWSGRALLHRDLDPFIAWPLPRLLDLLRAAEIRSPPGARRRAWRRRGGGLLPCAACCDLGVVLTFPAADADLVRLAAASTEA